ncbi:P-loop containing nucleoside triphosphate hydrolase protein [Pisolithus tinctorius]|nr:P-loop containing nucleoside triphosphate hydrolase protein [Pisolithus tinctorius]
MTDKFTRNIILIGEKEVVKSFIGVVSRTRPLETQVDHASKDDVSTSLKWGLSTQVVLWETTNQRIGAASKRMTQDMRALQHLQSSYGIDLILFCVKARMSQSEDFVRLLLMKCTRKNVKGKFPSLSSPLDWNGSEGICMAGGRRTRDNMFHLGLAFDVHACITTLHSHDDPCIQEQISISQTRVEALLQIRDYTQQLCHDPICSDESLENAGGIPWSLQTRTVVIVGATGVGKSSIINAIAGEKRAQISSDTDACTRECKAFLVELKPGVITEVWDTFGWDGSLIEKVTGHVQRLVNTRGVDLLLFCVRAGDTAKSHVDKFKRNIQPICGKRILVALVVTGLEGESDMDSWWTNNKDASVFHELVVDVHACVTTSAKSADPIYQQRIQSSRRRLRELVQRPIPSSISLYELTRECAVIFLLGSTGCGKSLVCGLLWMPQPLLHIGWRSSSAR